MNREAQGSFEFLVVSFSSIRELETRNSQLETHLNTLPSPLDETFRQRHLNLIPLNPDSTAGDCDVRIFRSFAGLHIESPSVPWALDDATVKMTFSKRSSCMRAGVIDGMEGSVDIE